MRQEAEARHGVGYIKGDLAILEDGEYGDALDLGTKLDQALIDLTALIDHLWHAEQTSHTDGAR
jgi:hypothetical protein